MQLKLFIGGKKRFYLVDKKHRILVLFGVLSVMTGVEAGCNYNGCCYCHKYNGVWWPLYRTCQLLLLHYPYWYCWSVDTETWMQTQHISTMWFITIMFTNSVIFCVVNLVITVNSECKLSASDTRYESKLCSSKHIADAVSEVSECKPRPVVVELPWPNNTNIHRMTPTHVEVNIRSYFKERESNIFSRDSDLTTSFVRPLVINIV